MIYRKTRLMFYLFYWLKEAAKMAIFFIIRNFCSMKRAN